MVAARMSRHIHARETTPAGEAGKPLRRRDGHVEPTSRPGAPPSHRCSAGWPAADARTAPLAAAFWRLKAAVDPSPVPFLVPAHEQGGLCATIEYGSTEQAFTSSGAARQLYPKNYSPTPLKGAGHVMASTIKTREDDMCHERLRSLGSVGKTYKYGRHFVLASLMTFIAGLNATRPWLLRFDTVVINTEMYDAILEDPYKILPPYGCVSHGIIWNYRDMFSVSGTSFLHYHGIPFGCAYAMSRNQAPRFVYGPSTIVSASYVQVPTRQSGFVEPPRNMPECPWGVRFNVRKICEAGRM